MGLSKTTINDIKNGIINHYAQPRKEALEAEKLALGELIYKEKFQPHLKALNGLPKDWTGMSDLIEVKLKDSSESYTLPLAEPRIGGRVERSYNRVVLKKLFSATDPLWIQTVALFDRIKELQTTVYKLEMEVEANLGRFSSIKKLRDEWPEAYRFARVREEDGKITALAMPITDLNQRLGLDKLPAEPATQGAA